MKATKSLLALSILAACGPAKASVWQLEMNTSVFVPATNGPLNMIGFRGTWDDVTNLGSWSGTTTIPSFATTMHYTQTFTMNEATGVGTLNQFDIATCTDNTGSACAGLSSAFMGPLKNTAVNPADPNDYKKQLPFTPTSGWSGQWTLQINRTFTNPDGTTGLAFIPVPMNVCFPNLEGCPPTVPIPAAAWLFGSGMLGLAGAARRRRSAGTK